MSDHKIIFTGPIGAGKTTAISVLSDIAMVSTDEVASDMTRNRKVATTVAMDYGVMNLDGQERIHLYGTPGEERFDFMWDILSKGGIGIILLVNNARPDPFQDMHFFLDAFEKYLNLKKVVIGVTKMDEVKQPAISDYHLQMEVSGRKLPIFEVDAREYRDVSLLIEALLYSLDPIMVT